MTKIRKTEYADTRCCDKIPTKNELLENSKIHIEDVKSVLNEIGNIFINSTHDFTKIKNIDQFYKDFVNSKNNKINFIEGKWYKDHITTERHHPEAYEVDDINLMDIIEYIVDNVCAGKARSGKIRELQLSPETIFKAYKNTIKYIDGITC